MLGLLEMCVHQLIAAHQQWRLNKWPTNELIEDWLYCWFIKCFVWVPRASQQLQACLYRSSISYGFSEASTSHEPGSHSTGDRLKPPPDTVNFEHKKIKLNSSSKSDDLESIQMKRLKKFENSDPNGDILDRIIIKDRRKEKEKERKSEAQNMKQKRADDSITDTPLGQSRSPDSGSSNGKKQLESRKIKLKRSHCSSSSEVR